MDSIDYRNGNSTEQDQPDSRRDLLWELHDTVWWNHAGSQTADTSSVDQWKPGGGQKKRSSNKPTSPGMRQKEQPQTESAGAVQCPPFVPRGTQWSNYYYYLWYHGILKKAIARVACKVPEAKEKPRETRKENAFLPMPLPNKWVLWPETVRLCIYLGFLPQVLNSFAKCACCHIQLVHETSIYLESGGYSQRNWVRVCNCFPKPLPYLWPVSMIFHSLFLVWPKIQNPIYDLTLTSKYCFRPAL